MVIAGISLDNASLAGLVLAGLVVLSVISLYNYFFGGADPLMKNAHARVEAARSPNELVAAGQDWRDRRRKGCLLLIFIAVLALVLFEPNTANRIAEILWSLVMRVVELVQRSAQVLTS